MQFCQPTSHSVVSGDITVVSADITVVSVDITSMQLCQPTSRPVQSADITSHHERSDRVSERSKEDINPASI